MEIQQAHQQLLKFLNNSTEFLIIDSGGKAFEFRTVEVELRIDRGRILISFPDDSGFQTWRILELEVKELQLNLDISRAFGKFRGKIRIVPRISAAKLEAEIEIARIEKAHRISRVIAEQIENLKIVRVSLNRENGRFAEIVIDHERQQKAVLTDVSETVSPELTLSMAIRWISKLERRQKNPIDKIWILASPKPAKNLQKLLALLTENWRRKISVFEFDESKEIETLTRKNSVALSDLWREKPAKLKFSEKTNRSATAHEIIRLSPEHIDCIAMKSGESLRFHGLQFARVRRVFETEKCWFGVECERRQLNESSFEDFEKLIADLELYRKFDSPNTRHELYRQSPEAWLEAILRRNIKTLDANLVLSPIYNQFRAANDKIDLLALRRDGRLVIIELKVAPDREMIFQGIDYWRKVELLRRKGVLKKAKIFGDLEIADKPTIVYLVAPALSFHHDFRFLANTISKEIEIYRFELTETWRENLKVLSRDLV